MLDDTRDGISEPLDLKISWGRQTPLAKSAFGAYDSISQKINPDSKLSGGWTVWTCCWMLSVLFSDSGVGIYLRFHTDGYKPFNFRRLKSKTKVIVDIIRDFLLLTTVPSMLQTSLRCKEVWSFSLHFNSKNFCLTINTKKNQVMHQSAPGTLPTESTIDYYYELF